MSRRKIKRKIKTSDTTNTKVNAQQSKNIPSSNTEQNKSSDLEFKLGSNALNIIGVMMILIALVTFGKYIYTNFMTDTLKGLSLFFISSMILAAGECIFSKRVPKFAVGISALGIGSLYSSIIINLLFLQTINFAIAILFTSIVTAISLYISKQKNSNIIRIIGLIGAYICFTPTCPLSTSQSYVTVMILLIVSASNAYMPLDDEKFSIYSSITNALLCYIVAMVANLDNNAIIMYLSITILINNISYGRLSINSYNIRHHVAGILTMLFLINTSYNVAYEEHFVGLYNIAIALISYCVCKNDFKNLFYCQGVLSALILLGSYLEVSSFIYSIIYCTALFSIMYLISKQYDHYLNYMGITLVAIGLVISLFVDILSFLVYASSFISIIWIIAAKNKNYNPIVFLRHSLLFVIITRVLFRLEISSILGVEFSKSLIIAAILIGYVFIVANIERLKDENYLISNMYILFFAAFIINIFAVDTIIRCMFTIAISMLIMSIASTSKYVSNNIVSEKEHLVRSIYLTYGICLLFINSPIESDINNLLASIALISFAFFNVWAGFKVDKPEVRKYGLILSFIICIKLILIDFYAYDFIIKTMLFLIVGIVALVISYIYSKLEQDLKKKDKESSN